MVIKIVRSLVCILDRVEPEMSIGSYRGSIPYLRAKLSFP